MLVCMQIIMKQISMPDGYIKGATSEGLYTLKRYGLWEVRSVRFDEQEM